jgi:hypothetical protein
MLRIERLAAWRAKCPRHPNHQYDDPGRLPASCSVCHALWRVYRAQEDLRAAKAQVEAIGAIVRIERRKPQLAS